MFIWKNRTFGNVCPVSFSEGIFIKGLFFLVSLPFLLLHKSTAQSLKRFEFSERHMGTEAKIILYTSSDSLARAASTAAYKRFEQLNKILSDYDEESELSKLSLKAGSGEKVKVSRDLWVVLKKSQEISKITDGAFDVTVGPLSRLWRRARRQHEMPGEEMIVAAKALVGFEKMILFPIENAVLLSDSGMRIDLGGIGGGYAVDEAFKILKEYGIRCALIDLGGDILTGAAPPGKKGWTIQVEELNSKGIIVTKTILIENSAVTTSGDLYQFFEYKGKRYSHLINPKTGYGLSDSPAATTFARSAIEADAWASAISILGANQAQKILHKRDDLKFTLIWKSNGYVRQVKGNSSLKF